MNIFKNTIEPPKLKTKIQPFQAFQRTIWVAQVKVRKTGEITIWIKKIPDPDKLPTQQEIMKDGKRNKN